MTILQPVPPDVVRELQDMLLPNQPGWVAPLGPNNFRLLRLIPVLDHDVQQVEIMERVQVQVPNHARIYFQPVEDFIPTIIFGHYQAVANAAVQDGKTAIALSGTSRTLSEDGITLTVPDDILWLPGLQQILQANPKLMVMTRRTTFVLKEMLVTRVRRAPAVVKIFRNQFAPSEFFARVESLDEGGRVVEEVPNICLTNSADYVARHRSVAFTHLPAP